MKAMDELVAERGFESEAELHRLIAAVDLALPGALARFARFKGWQFSDGSKAGLLREFPELAAAPSEAGTA